MFCQHSIMKTITEAAIESGVGLVNTNYGYETRPSPQTGCGEGDSHHTRMWTRPGIDLVIYGHAVKQFDENHVLNSYCGGFPEKKACTNPMNYKISWNWDMVSKILEERSRVHQEREKSDHFRRRPTGQ